MRWLLATVILSLSTPAFPCVKIVRLRLEEVPRLVSSAESALEEGQYQRVLSLLHAVHGGPLAARASLLRAVAWLRLGSTQGALETLRPLLAADPENPYLRARVAEALSRTEAGAPEALATLADLEARDLVPDAEAWATLARLRAAAHDAAGRERAALRCRASARRADVCAAPTGASS